MATDTVSRTTLRGREAPQARIAHAPPAAEAVTRTAPTHRLDAAPIAVVPIDMRRARPHQPRVLLALGCALAGLLLALDAGWIHAKAALAQVLLDRAWTRTMADGDTHRPWPWADTWPVARLSVPRLDRSQIVLAGDSGRTLAFGPGWAEASAPPNDDGTTVVSGHRDTHFAWIKELLIGDIVSIDTGDATADYLVANTRVVDSNRERIDIERSDDTLLLVTCWPFDAVVAGGPLRYVVTARRLDAPGAPIWRTLNRLFESHARPAHLRTGFADTSRTPPRDAIPPTRES